MSLLARFRLRRPEPIPTKEAKPRLNRTRLGVERLEDRAVTSTTSTTIQAFDSNGDGITEWTETFVDTVDSQGRYLSRLGSVAVSMRPSQ
jgi:hypothetical protein